MKKITEFGDIIYKNYADKVHRIGLPAFIGQCEYYVYNEWVFNGKPHKINGKSYPRYDFQNLYDKQINLNIDKLVL